MNKEETLAEEKQVAFNAGQIACVDFHRMRNANFPFIPYTEQFNDLRQEWLRGFEHAMNDEEDIDVCEDCGSKNIWYSLNIVWCNYNTDEERKVDEVIPEALCFNCSCDSTHYLSQHIQMLKD